MTSLTPRQQILQQARILLDGQIFIFASLLFTLATASVYIWRTPAQWEYKVNVIEAPFSQVSPIAGFISDANDLTVTQAPAFMLESYVRHIPVANLNKSLSGEYNVFAQADTPEKSRENVILLLQDANEKALSSLTADALSKARLVVEQKKLEIEYKKEIISSSAPNLLPKRFLDRYLNDQILLKKSEKLTPPNFSKKIVTIFESEDSPPKRITPSPAMIFSIAIVAGLLIGCFLAIAQSVFKA